MAIIEKHESELFSLSHSLDTNPVDEWFNYHIHDGYELFCLVKGKVSYVVEGHIYKLRPGAILLMRSSEAHKLIVNESDEYERYVFNFRPELFSLFSKELLTPFTERALGERNLYLPSELGVSAISVFEKIFTELSLICPKDVILANASSLFSAVLRAFLDTSRHINAKDKSIPQEIISYINEHLSDELSLDKIAKEVHLSASQTNRIFKEIAGTSVYDYILSKRLILFQEKRALGKSALEASQECGFRDYSSFYRLYKKRMGISPTRIEK